MSNLRKYLVKHRMYLKAEECSVFDHLKVKSPAAAAAAAKLTLASLQPKKLTETVSEASTTSLTSSCH